MKMRIVTFCFSIGFLSAHANPPSTERTSIRHDIFNTYEEEIAKILNASCSSSYSYPLSALVAPQLMNACRIIRSTAIPEEDKGYYLDRLFSFFKKCRPHLAWQEILPLIPELIKSYSVINGENSSNKTDISRHISCLKSIISNINIDLKEEKRRCYASLAILKISPETIDPNDRAILKKLSQTDAIYATASTFELSRFFYHLLCNSNSSTQQSVIRLLEMHPIIVDHICDYIILPMIRNGGRADQNLQKCTNQQSELKINKKKKIPTVRNMIAPLWIAAKRRGDRKSETLWGIVLGELEYNATYTASDTDKKKSADEQDTWSRYQKKVKNKRLSRQGRLVQP